MLNHMLWLLFCLMLGRLTFHMMLVQVNNSLSGKIRMEWNVWPLNICLKHLEINIWQIKPSPMKEVAEMSDVVNIPS